MFSVRSKELLEKICEPITNGFGINYIKYQLFEGGLLVGKADSSTYETKQIWVYDEHGKEIRKRCYKLCREKIDQEDIAEAVTDIFSDVLCLGPEQKITFQKAVQRAVERVESCRDEMEVIGRELKGLLEEGSNRSVTSKIYGKFDSAFRKVRMSAVPDILQPGRVTVLDLDGFSIYVQKMLPELILSILWRYYRIEGQKKEEPLYIVCDEFQNLSMRPDSVLGQILCEGRKFHMAMLLATQTMEQFDRSEKALLLQAATQICFRPGPDEVKAVFKRLGAEQNRLGENRLSGLQRGECIASGRFCIGSEVREGPVKMTFQKSSGSSQRLD